ncbi:MAG: hypothetical protein ACRD19_17525 [Terriglobia bacterium]
MSGRNRQRNPRSGRAQPIKLVKPPRGSAKRRERKSRTSAYVIAIAIAVLVAAFLIRRAVEPTSIRYIAPPHQHPVTVYPQTHAEAPGAPGSALHNGAAGGQNGIILSPAHPPDGNSGTENLTPEERQALNALIQRKTAH